MIKKTPKADIVEGNLCLKFREIDLFFLYLAEHSLSHRIISQKQYRYLLNIMDDKG